ncbi:hypothetical protein MMC27_006129 [Xylographa pallens]|nr:hypothetical protein [Xylographa pallens]
MRKLLLLLRPRPRPPDQPKHAPPPSLSAPAENDVEARASAEPAMAASASPSTAPPPNNPTPSPARPPFQPIPRSITQPLPSLPATGAFPSPRFVVAGGVAIFHLASARVVVCRHSLDGDWFLPKGRRDAGEESRAGAEREGFEESGYRNRVLPLPLHTRQPVPYNVAEEALSPFVADPLLVQLLPVSGRCQYVLFWYVAETVPPEVEAGLDREMEEAATGENPTPYRVPPGYPEGLTLAARVRLEEGGYEPVHHPNTAVDAEEALYESHLLPVEEAIYRLRRTSLQHEIVRCGWNAVCARYEMEAQTP